MKSKNDGWIAAIIVVGLLVIDQIIKIWVKTNMALYDTITITSWFKIYFIENNGMAYGMTFIPKDALSLFRIAAVAAIGYYLAKLIKGEHRRGYVVCLAMIMAGAAGNIFDSLFYGLCFDASTPMHVSQWVPFGTGYAPVLHGRVVDMFYFPLIVTTWPEWMPWVGGDAFIFFSPVFNFADACISVGVVVLILFFRKELENINSVVTGKKEASTAENETTEVTQQS